MDPVTIGVVGASVLASLGVASWTGLKGWHEWLELKKLELSSCAAERGMPPAAGRIEMADLKERIRKLEAIAAGIDI